MSPIASTTLPHDRSHVGWVVDDDAYRAQAATLLAEGKDLGQKPAVFGPHASAALAELRPLAAVAADPYVDVLGRGPLDPPRMLAMLREQSARAHAEGHAGLRVVADMDWLLPAAPSTADVVAFEVLLDRVVGELDASVLCAYRRGSAIAQTARSRAATLELRGTRGSLRRYWALARLDELAPSVTLA